MCNNKINKITEAQYSLVEQRRQSSDTMLWQTPVLSLTAQAFLFTIALAHDTKLVPRIIAALLAAIAALTSAQLMAKHRYLEVTDSKMLEHYEEDHAKDGYALVHSRGFAREWNTPHWLVDLSSYTIWLVMLCAFGFTALVVAVLAKAAPSLF